MMTINFVTSNSEKLQIAENICGEAGFTVTQVAIDVDEIQGEDPDMIVRDKAIRAYEKLQQPLVVSDDSWDIPALGGFPGAYMKSVNQWFSADDFIRLMHGIEDRRIILHQHLAFTDGKVVQVFTKDIPGVITAEARGVNKKSPSMTVTALDWDDGKTLAEVFETGAQAALTNRHSNRPEAWHDVVEWYRKKYPSE